MTTIRGKVPILISDLMLLGTELVFQYNGVGPLIQFKTRGGKIGHYHLMILDGTHGENSLQLEHSLVRILETAQEEQNGAA